MSTINHPALLSEFPEFSLTDHELSCDSPWYANCDLCRSVHSQRLSAIKAWASSAYDERTTGKLRLSVEVSEWSRTNRRFEWYKATDRYTYPESRWVCGYRFSEASGEASFYDLRSALYKTVWSRMNQGHAGYRFLVPPASLTTLPIRAGERNHKGYLSVRYTSCEFTPISEISSEYERSQFVPLAEFGNSYDWSRSYCD